MSEHNHTGLDEAASVASNTVQAVRTGKAISAAAKGAAAGGPYGAAIGAALSARKHIGKIAAAALVLLALPLPPRQAIYITDIYKISMSVCIVYPRTT